MASKVATQSPRKARATQQPLKPATKNLDLQAHEPSPAFAIQQAGFDPYLGVTALQATIGNQAVQRLLRNKPEELKEGSRTSASADFAPDLSRVPGPTRAAEATVQRYGAFEHKRMGDLGGDHATYKYSEFSLTHGDIVMLSGDLFDARETDEEGKPIPDNLFKLANTPSAHPGAELWTRDEVLYALYRENPNDPRFKNVCYAGKTVKQEGPANYQDPKERDKGAVDIGYDMPAPDKSLPLVPDASGLRPYFSDEVKKAVDMRYLRLAAQNREHFVDPEGKGGSPKDGNFASAGGSYRAMHETAIKMAHEAGLSGTPIDQAMAYEAAAQHYLTDAFASGHLRTPTAAIKTHWDDIYPNFWENFKRYIAHKMAISMNATTTNLSTILGTVAYIEDNVYANLQKVVNEYPPMGFEHLVRLATHDFDNVQGLHVINDLGDSWVTYGDSQMKYAGAGKADAETIAIKAIKLGIADIQQAYKLPIVVTDPHAAVRAATAAPATSGDKYGSEQAMPRIDPAKEHSQQTGWNAKNIGELWDAKIRSDESETYGHFLESSAQSGDIAHQIADMEAKVPVKEEKGTGDVYPQAAFHGAITMRLKAETRPVLEEIINFDPSEGQAGFNEDDAIMEEMDRMDKRDKDKRDKAKGKAPKREVEGLTLEQRATWIKALMGGTVSVVYEDEEERILEIFKTCPHGQRQQLYKMIEGHEWTGDYREGVFVDDDELYNSLSGKELKEVRQLINEG